MAQQSAGYASALIGVVDLMTGASADAAYKAAYGSFYSSYQGMHNAANRKVAAEANISAINQDRIHTDKVIDMQQDQAEAEAKLLAAVTGTEGQSVEATIYQTELNSSVAKSNNKAQAKQQVENQLATIYQSQSTMLALDNPDIGQPTLASSLISNLSPMVATQGAEIVEGVGGLFTPEEPQSLEGIMAVNYQTPTSGGVLQV